MRYRISTPISAAAASLALGLLAVAGLPTHAAALPIAGVQPQDGVEYMVVDADTATIRAGDQDVFYAVGVLEQGQVLRTAGTSGAYTRVVVPDSIGAFVPASEVAPTAGLENTVTLKVDSRLRAPSQLLGLSGSWKQLYAQPLPAGTELRVNEVLKNEAGAIVGYRVHAPTSPAGELPVAFVKTDALRPALDTEIQAYRRSRGEQPTQPSPQSRQPRTEPAAQPEARPQPESTPDLPAQREPEPESFQEPAQEEVDTSLMQEMDTGEEKSHEPVVIANTAPTTSDGAPDRRRAEEGQISASQLEDLEAAFARARSMPRDELDQALSELLAEFTRARNEAEEGSALATALDQRIEWVKLRIMTRDQRREIAQALAEYDARADELAQSIEQWQQSRAYNLVGRMVTSSVYTGQNLPLLYRIQGVDPITGEPRTVGYVAPGPDQDLRHLLGRVVGVIGVPTEDESLRLTVIEPQRVDPMPE